MDFIQFRENAMGSMERVQAARDRAKERASKRLAKADPRGQAVRDKHKEISER